MTSFSVVALVDHLWQSTLFAVVAGCLTLLLRKNSARVRCLLWLAASVKFLVPFTWLAALGARIPWPHGSVHGIERAFFSIAGEKIVLFTRFGADDMAALPQIAHAATYRTTVLAGFGLLWALGVLALVAHWYARWQQVRRALRVSTPMSMAFPIPVRSSVSQLEPAVVGILRPVLLLPKDLERRLSSAELHAVLAHEHCHVSWQDNLTATVHMLVEALFWFHPLIWWLGARIVDERERACDEHVLAAGHKSATYAEGILKVCEHYLSCGLACVAGIGGADLRQRIDGIMTVRQIKRLGAVRALVITLAACATFAVPVALGLLSSPRASAQAQTTAAPADFEQADIGQIAAAVAKATHKTFVIDPRVQVTGISAHLGAKNGGHASMSQLYLGPPRAWELRDEVWLGFPNPAAQSRRP